MYKLPRKRTQTHTECEDGWTNVGNENDVRAYDCDDRIQQQKPICFAWSKSFWIDLLPFYVRDLAVRLEFRWQNSPRLSAKRQSLSDESVSDAHVIVY